MSGRFFRRRQNLLGIKWENDALDGINGLCHWERHSPSESEVRIRKPSVGLLPVHDSFIGVFPRERNGGNGADLQPPPLYIRPFCTVGMNPKLSEAIVFEWKLYERAMPYVKNCLNCKGEDQATTHQATFEGRQELMLTMQCTSLAAWVCEHDAGLRPLLPVSKTDVTKHVRVQCHCQ